MEMTKRKVEQVEGKKVSFSVEDAQSILQEEEQRNMLDGQAEVQEVLDRRNLRIAISMTLLENGRNIPNIQLVPRQQQQQ